MLSTRIQHVSVFRSLNLCNPNYPIIQWEDRKKDFLATEAFEMK